MRQAELTSPLFYLVFPYVKWGGEILFGDLVINEHKHRKHLRT